MSDVRLHGYFRSSAAYRVRIGLHLKGIAFEPVPVHLRRGIQRGAEFRAINPAGLVPVMQLGTCVLTQSLAILEYLDETRPDPPLLPTLPEARAYVRAIAASIACDIHPLNNLRVLERVRQLAPSDPDVVNDWYRHWIAEGFTALESTLSVDPRVGSYCYGDAPTLADVALVPQWYNAERFECALDLYPTLARIVAHARRHPAFEAAAPERQPDAE